MIRLAISVEGQTEETFVKDVLADHLQSKDVAPIPVLLGAPERAVPAAATSASNASYRTWSACTGLSTP